MVITHNMTALHAQRQGRIKKKEKEDAAERMSSGYQINKAADDAAGLEISEKIRAMVRGMNRASMNAQEGISLIQVGDGALNEVHDMLHRLSELSIQSANGTYVDGDRDGMQDELKRICAEIDNIAKSTNFNRISLFQDEGYECECSNGDASAYVIQQTSSFSIEALVQSAEELLQADGYSMEAAAQSAEELLQTDGYSVEAAVQSADERMQTSGYSMEAAVQSAGELPEADSYSRKAAVPFQGLEPLQLDNSGSQETVQSSGQEEGLPEGLPEHMSEDEINIIFTAERTDEAVTTTQSPSGSSTLGSDIIIGGKALSQILKTEIIPNTVNNILANYPAFSYLKGSSIGIGLRYFTNGSSGGTTTLAYVEGKVEAASSGTGRKDYVTYTLGVNTSVLQNVQSRADLSELEATIAHEMIHAFMDEALTSGMFGVVEDASGGLSQNTAKHQFPSWFVEGMAQTASGPGNWLKSSTLNISAQSTDAQILTAIRNNKLSSGSTASEYGTGYLACMYLGAVIAGGGTRPAAVDAAVISDGLGKLMNQVIGGKSLNDAVNTLTNGTFTSISDFTAKFDAGLPDAAAFTRDLLTATGSGRGGIVSGDLKAADLTPDTVPGTKVNLFELNPNNEGVKNLYPDGYQVFSGGTASASGTPPTGFTPSQAPDYGDFVITGAAAGDVSYDANTNTLTVSGNSDVQISLKAGVSSSNGKIAVQGTGKVTLSNVNLGASDALTVKTDAEITYTGTSKLGGILLDSGTDVTFKGTGRLEAGTFTSDNSNTVRFQGGAVLAGNNGSGSITASNIIIDNASVTASLSSQPKNSSGEALYAVDLPWAGKLGGLTADIVSIDFDGVKSDMQIGNGQKATLWMSGDLSASQPARHTVMVTDAKGVSKTLLAEFDPSAAAPGFKWIGPFQVLKDGAAAQEGIDYVYEGEKLVIKQAGNFTLSGGTISGVNGVDIKGSIRLDDNLGAVNIVLDGVTCKPSSGCAMDLGSGNQVTLKLKDGQDNQFESGANAAGIRLGDNTNLTVENESGSSGSGKLETKGGSGSAGIGCSKSSNASNSSITIQSGKIIATGGINGAGIGAGYAAGFGNIEIFDGDIEATGGIGGAGIGGGGNGISSNNGNVGNITIAGGVIVATSNQHGAGIGGGFGPGVLNGTITISGGTITAESKEHGTGIGAGCQGTSSAIKINGSAYIKRAIGGEGGAGIGASRRGECTDITISEDAVIEEARGGNKGAGIGSGNYGSKTDNILIDTNGVVNAYGGEDGVGIGSGYSGTGEPTSECLNIDIKKGTVYAQGDKNATGIGSGRGSISGNISIGDAANPNNKVVVTAKGGMTHNGGNILSYTDKSHSDGSEGKITITGNGTTVQPGGPGEGKYSTSGVTTDKGESYAYPVYLFKDKNVLDAGKNLETLGLLPLDSITGLDKKDISKIKIESDKGISWNEDLSHKPLEENYVFLWLPKGDQKLTISYELPDGSKGQTVLDLKFYPDAGVFRVKGQDEPKPAEKPDYHPIPGPGPVNPTPDAGSDGKKGKGIILQVGANPGNKLEIPRFYFSLSALELQKADISTEDKAGEAISIIQDAVTKVSRIRASYGAYQNRLEHIINNLNQTSENLAAAESRIRDVDMAKEAVNYAAASILTQAAEAMLSHRKRDKEQVAELLQGL